MRSWLAEGISWATVQVKPEILRDATRRKAQMEPICAQERRRSREVENAYCEAESSAIAPNKEPVVGCLTLVESCSAEERERSDAAINFDVSLDQAKNPVWRRKENPFVGRRD